MAVGVYHQSTTIRSTASWDPDGDSLGWCFQAVESLDTDDLRDVECRCGHGAGFVVEGEDAAFAERPLVVEVMDDHDVLIERRDPGPFARMALPGDSTRAPEDTSGSGPGIRVRVAVSLAISRGRLRSYQ